MELNSKLKFKYEDRDWELRPLQPSDISEKYILSLSDQEHIKMTSSKINKAKQKIYIEEIQQKENQFINGFFVDDVFIGTSGVQLENKFLNFYKSNNEQIGLIGIFLFDKNYTGRGFGKVLVWASTFLFNESLGIKFFGAGMKKINLASFHSFKSCGYKIFNEDNVNYKVLLNYNDLIQSENILKPRVI